MKCGTQTFCLKNKEGLTFPENSSKISFGWGKKLLATPFWAGLIVNIILLRRIVDI